MTVHRKGKGRGWVYRWREADADGVMRKRTSVEFATRTAAEVDQQAHAYRLELATRARIRPHREGLSLEAVALSHPSSQHDPDHRRAEYLRYLQAFADHAGIHSLHQVTVAHVQAWIAAMIARGFAWDTRRHYLLYVRRACAMGPSHGLPDVLNRLRLDRRTDQIETQAWTLADLAELLRATAAAPAARAAIVLGGVMGLRPSEIVRAQVGDLSGDLLEVGARKRKRRASHRRLPVPDLCLPWLRVACRDGLHLRRHDAPLIVLPDSRIEAPLRLDVLNRRLGAVIAESITPGPVKRLRKTCATWLRRTGQGGDLVEAWLGHDTPLRSSITSQHYTADLLDLLADELRPIAAHLDRTLSAALANVGDTTGDRGTERGKVIAFADHRGPP